MATHAQLEAKQHPSVFTHVLHIPHIRLLLPTGCGCPARGGASKGLDEYVVPWVSMVVPGVMRYLSDPLCVRVSRGGGGGGGTCVTGASWTTWSGGSAGLGVSAEPGLSGSDNAEVISRGLAASGSTHCNSGGGVQVRET
jgi:hypothetical protein